jgi:AcrR family transcriptional regulator
MQLREQKKSATRQRLVAVAVRAFSVDGYAETTVDDIAGAAGVSPRTFFHYFPTKQDVLLGHERALLADLVAAVTDADASHSAARALWDAVERLAQHFDRESAQLRPLYALIIGEPSVHRRSLELQTEWEHELAGALSPRLRGQSRDHRAHVLAATALACLRSSARQWATQIDGRSLHSRLRGARQSLLRDLDDQAAA